MPITIETATEADLPAMVQLLGLLFDQEEDFRPDPAKQERGLRPILNNPNKGILLIAREADKVVGMVNLLFTISTAEGAPVIMLEDLVVHPDARGKGIGQALLAESVAYAKREGYARITLLTDKMNARAKALYARFGFKVSSMTPLRLVLNEE